MSEMVERVASALCRSVDCAADLSWDEVAEDIKDSCRKDARAAIEAMREPTEAMTKAGEDEPIMHSHGSGGEFNGSPGATWAVMIDAALADPK